MSHSFSGRKVQVWNWEITQIIAGKDLKKQRNGLSESQEVGLGIRKWVIVRSTAYGAEAPEEIQLCSEIHPNQSIKDKKILRALVLQLAFYFLLLSVIGQT